MTDKVTEKALRSIVTQFRGGEHALAGKRASELVYGKKAKLNEDFLERLKAEVPGIENHIVPPGDVTGPQIDEGGNTLATQPENDPQQNVSSNVSSEQARAEQNEIDDRLAAGRQAAQEASGDTGDGAEGNQAVGSTELNPKASDADGKPTERKKASAKSTQKKPGA